MRLDVDVDGADEVADALTSVPDEALPKFRKVVSKGALNIKNRLQRDARSSGQTRHFARSISYDLLDDLEAEIGPDLGRVQGPLGFLYTGTSRHGPVLDLHGPVDREQPRFELALADVAEDVL